MTPAFTGVGVVVPARDEEARIARCLAGVLAALERLPGSVDRAVCVVLDRCTDATAALAARVAADTHVPVDLVVNNWPPPSACCATSGCCGFSTVWPAPSGRTWLLSTDADTVAEPGWVLDHLRHARAGAHAVAGLADLDDPSGSSHPGPPRLRAAAGGRCTAPTATTTSTAPTSASEPMPTSLRAGSPPSPTERITG